MYPGACGERKFGSFVVSLIPSILYTVSSLNVLHLRYEQFVYHLAPVLLEHLHAYPAELLALLPVRKR